MIANDEIQLEPRVETALNELEGLISARFPQATFSIQEGFDPPGIRLVVTVDIDDTDEVMDVIIERLVDMQVEEGLPVYVLPMRPPERVLAQLQEQKINRPRVPLPLD